MGVLKNSLLIVSAGKSPIFLKKILTHGGNGLT